ncbi:hypothetical protein LNO18_15850 [Klebsiella variicola subsp. variicola]|nr:hypothetical protein [Klebsiella variicola subsp. variicola]
MVSLFIGVGINMIRGHIADALMVMAIKLHEEHISWPELLLSTLHQFSTNDHPAVRAVVLRRLPFLQSILPEVGWGVFELIMRKGSEGLWDMAECCLYYTYNHGFDRVSPWLNKIVSEDIKDGLQAWGRISALAVLSGKIENCDFIKQLKELSDSDAWEGAIDVWTHHENFQRHQDLCLAGLSAALSDDNQYSSALIASMGSLFWRERAGYYFTRTSVRALFFISIYEFRSIEDWFIRFWRMVKYCFMHRTIVCIEGYGDLS